MYLVWKMAGSTTEGSGACSINYTIKIHTYIQLYTYIHTYIHTYTHTHTFLHVPTAPVGQTVLTVEVSRSLSDTHTVGRTPPDG